MARQTSKGTCIFCHGELSKSAMTGHLETCEQRAITEAKAGSRQKAQQTRKLHLVVEGRDLFHHAALAGWGNSSTTHFGMMFILASCYLRCGYIRQCLLIQMVLVRMYRGARTRTKSANSMSMTVEAKSESEQGQVCIQAGGECEAEGCTESDDIHDIFLLVCMFTLP